MPLLVSHFRVCYVSTPSCNIISDRAPEGCVPFTSKLHSLFINVIHSNIAMLFPSNTPSFSSSDKNVALPMATISYPYVFGGAYGKSYAKQVSMFPIPCNQRCTALSAPNSPTRKPIVSRAHHTPTNPAPVSETPAQQHPRTNA